MDGMDQKPSNEGRAGQFQGILFLSVPRGSMTDGSPSRVQTPGIEVNSCRYCCYLNSAYTNLSLWPSLLLLPLCIIFYPIPLCFALPQYQQSHRPHHHHRESIHVFRGLVSTTVSFQLNSTHTPPFLFTGKYIVNLTNTTIIDCLVTSFTSTYFMTMMIKYIYGS